MSANATDIFSKQYSSVMQLLLQQPGSKLRSAVTEKMGYTGSQASPVAQMGAVEMQQVTTRFGAIGRVDAAFKTRWVNPGDWDLPQLIDSFDELRLLVDPRSHYVQNALMAAGRKIDDIIIAAFFASASTGTSGSSTTTFSADGGTQIAVNEGAGSNTNMTVAKLRAGVKTLRANEVDVDREQIYCAMSASQLDSLFQEAQVVSTDFNSKPVLADGKLVSFMGVNFIHSERLGVDGSSYRRCPLWAKSGMHLGIWGSPMTSVDKRIDLSGHPWQAYLKLTMGATRLEGEKICEILCNEA
jgi:hypothetical protein